MTRRNEYESTIILENIKLFLSSKFLILGFLFGVCISEILSFSEISTFLDNHYRYKYYNRNNTDNYDVVEMQKDIGPLKDIGSHIHADEHSVANKLFKEVRVLCLILTSPKNHKVKAIHVKRTWGKRCNKLIFMSTAEDLELGSVALPVSEGRVHLWAKTKEAFKHVYKYYFDEYDWFLKADDDTYVILENLRYMLYAYNTDDPIYFGCRYKSYMKEGYMAGGSGYILSKEALRRFIEQALPDSTCDINYYEAEDNQMGKCLQDINIIFGDTRDELNRARFFPVRVQHQLAPQPLKNMSWYWKTNYYKIGQGIQSCADYSISFHQIYPEEMYQLEYYIYHLRLYGIEHRSVALLAKKMSN